MEKISSWSSSEMFLFRGFKLVRMSIEDSFEKGHSRLYLESRVVVSW